MSRNADPGAFRRPSLRAAGLGHRTANAGDSRKSRNPVGKRAADARTIGGAIRR